MGQVHSVIVMRKLHGPGEGVERSIPSVCFIPDTQFKSQTVNIFYWSYTQPTVLVHHKSSQMATFHTEKKNKTKQDYVWGLLF